MRAIACRAMGSSHHKTFQIAVDTKTEANEII